MTTIQSLIDKLQQLDTSLPLGVRLDVFGVESNCFQKWPATAPYQRDARRSELSAEDVRIVFSKAGATVGCELAIPVFVDAAGEIEQLDVGLIKPGQRQHMRRDFCARNPTAGDWTSYDQ